MGRELIALGSSDWHWNDWNQFNEDNRRLHDSVEFFSHIISEAEEKNVPILFGGDMFHTPKGINTKTFHYVSGVFRTAEDNFTTEIWGIDGNHDMSETNTGEKHSPSLFAGICNCFPKLFHNLAWSKKIFSKRSVQIFGVPYLTHNAGLSDYIKKISKDASYTSERGWRNILLLHTDIWGARDPSGREIGGVDNIPRNLGKFFAPFDLVLCGHIHKYDELWKGKVYMMGAPYQQRKSDKDCQMGYLKIYDDMTVKFVEYNAPVFKEYEEGTSHPDDGNYWIKIPKPKKRDNKDIKKFSSSMDRTKMAERYAEQKGIKSESKVNALINILNRIDDA